MTAPADTDDLTGEEEIPEEKEEPGRGLTRGVRWAGLALGTALVTYMYSAGFAPRIPGIPRILGLIAGFAIVMIMIAAAATALSWLLRWHHRDIAAWSWKHGRRTASWGYARGRHHGSRLLGWLTEWAAARWSARQGSDPDDEEPAPGGEHADPPPPWPVPDPDGPAAESYSWGLEGARHHWPAASREDAIDRARHSSTGGKEYVVCQYPPGGGPGTVIAKFSRGRAIPVEAGTAGEPAAADTGGPDGPGPRAPEGAPAPAGSPPPDGGEMPPVTTDRPVSATARTSGRKVPPVMRAVIAWIDDFEPENDADLHDFLQALAAGLHDVGASLNDLYELCTSPTVRIGKGGMTATHAAADSIAEAAGGVSGASKALASYYEGVTEEVGAGVELPKDGDFITGEGAGS